MTKKCRKFFKNGELELREIFKNRDFKELMEFAELSTAVCPDDFEGYFYLGVAYRGMGELENALESFKKAEKLANNQNGLGIIYRYNKLGIICQHIGEILIDMGRLDEAIIYLNKSLDSTKYVSENTAYMFSKIASIYYEKGDIEKAIEYYNEAFEIGKENASEEFIIKTANNLSNILFNLCYYEDIIDLFKSLLSYGFANNNISIVCLSEMSIGSAYLMTGNKIAAKEYFTLAMHRAKGIKNKKLETTACMYLGLITNKERYLEKAEELFKEIGQSSASIIN